MRHLKSRAAALLAALLLSACGGGGAGSQAPKVQFTSLVTFGDSLSDVGTYKVGTVAALGGGKYTVNSATDKNWTELLAAQIGVSAPCAAQTGLDGDAALGFSVSVQNFAACRNYAQGGSRVLHPVGPGNKNLGGANATLGSLTVPVVTQIGNHLTVAGGSFAGTELVTVLAGANDLFMQFGVLDTLGTANFSTYAQNIALWSAADVNTVNTALAGGSAAAIAAATPILVGKMSGVGTSLADLVKTQIVAKGAKYTLVLNLPNVSRTPFANSLNSPALSALLDAMTTAFNTALQAGLAGTSGVRFGDIYTTNTDQINNPSQYGLSNVTGKACNLTSPGNILGSSLVCKASNLNTGDVSAYLFADDVHPTPYGYRLLAQEAAKHLAIAGWL